MSYKKLREENEQKILLRIEKIEKLKNGEPDKREDKPMQR